MKIKLTRACFLLRKELLTIIMRTFIFLLCTTVFSFSSNNILSQNSKIVVEADKTVSIGEIFDMIRNQTKHAFIYHQDLFKEVPPVQLKKGIVKVNDLLKRTLLLPSNFKFKFLKDGTIHIKKNEILIKDPNVVQQTITGTVKDEEGNPVPGVHVYITQKKGSTYHRGMKGGTTNFEGYYFIKYTRGHFITFSSIGFQTQSISIDKKKTISVVLKESTNQLDEVLLTGYQKIRKEQSTGSFSQVTEKDLEKRISPQSNLLQKLEGLIPGMSWNPGFSYGIGGKKTLLIRGANSLHGNMAPLIVIDGYPTALAIEDINPDEVKSVTFLKDAAAAAVYGARASNGVIVIKRKRGVAGKTQFTFSNSISITQRQDLSYLNFASTKANIDLELEEIDIQIDLGEFNRAYYVQNHIPYSPVSGLKFDLLENKITQATFDQKLAALLKIDNVKEIEKELLREQWNQKYDFSMSGGGENNRYFGTISYQDNTLSQVGATSKRLRLGLRNDFKLSKRWTAKVDLNYYNNKRESAGILIDAQLAFLDTYSYEKFRDAKGKPLATTSSGRNKETNAQLLAKGLFDETDYYLNRLNDGSYKNTSNRYEINTTLSYQLKDWLTLEVGGIYARTQSLKSDFYKENSLRQRELYNAGAYIDEDTNEIVYAVPIGERLAETTAIAKEYTLRSLAKFNYQSKDLKHRISGIAGVELREVGSISKNNDKYGYNPKTLTHKPVDWHEINSRTNDLLGRPIFASGLQRRDLAGKENKRRFSSVFANGSYTYNLRYTLSAGTRLDKSNLFTSNPKLRDVPLWSVGASWNISKEDFFNTSSIVNSLKLRMSYGVTGNATNSATGAYNLGFYSLNDRTLFRQLEITSPKNAGIIWEQTKKTNIGVDFGILHNRIKGSIDLYNEQANNLLGNRRVDPTLGFPKIFKNYASVLNQGIEVSLHTVNINTDNFNWNSTINFSYNKNKVTDVEVTDIREFSKIGGVHL